MFHILKLLVPALIPSWKFFDIITESPRVEFFVMGADGKANLDWQEFRPRPQHLSISQMIKRLFWNAHWNESMFIIGCAERLLVSPTKHSEDEILKRIISDLEQPDSIVDWQTSSHLQFRVITIAPQGSELKSEIQYYSRIEKLSESVD